MANRVKLTFPEKKSLLRAVLYADNPQLKKRANAILLLDEGYTNEEAAVICSVSAKSIFNWKKRFLENRKLPGYASLSDNARTGRPHKKDTAEKRLLSHIAAEKPRVHGYDTDFWTVRLLQIHMLHHWDLAISDDLAWQIISKQMDRTKRGRLLTESERE